MVDCSFVSKISLSPFKLARNDYVEHLTLQVKCFLSLVIFLVLNQYCCHSAILAKEIDKNFLKILKEARYVGRSVSIRSIPFEVHGECFAISRLPTQNVHFGLKSTIKVILSVYRRNTVLVNTVVSVSECDLTPHTNWDLLTSG